MIAFKNFMMQKIVNITQKIHYVEQTNCTNKVKHLREENSSKNETTKILSKNMSNMATSANAKVRRRKITQASNSSNDILHHVPESFAKQHYSNTTQKVIRRSLLGQINLKIYDCRMARPMCHFGITKQIIHMM